MDFRSFRFGYADAETESVQEPGLLIDGFYDLGKMIHEAKDGNRFLFLGYKGSGKSSISQHLRLIAEQDAQLFVTQTFLAEFPYISFKKIIKGEAEPEAKYPATWSWLLLLQLFGSFDKDEGLRADEGVDYVGALQTLKNTGLLPTPSLKEVVRVSSKHSFRLAANALGVGGERAVKDSTIELPSFVERLRLISSHIRSESRHLLLIDGLDEILSARDVQYQSLAALVTEVGRLNLFFARHQTPAKIVLLCRTDLFERLPSANKNKLRQDSAVSLDWYHDSRDPGKSMLVQLANLRAGLVVEGVDIFESFFPVMEGRDARHFLLDLTRHTPRDFLQLLTNLQHFSGNGRLSSSQVLSGVRQYSIQYFMPEIRDELHGYVDRDSVDAALDLIGSLRTREFKMADLDAKAKGNPRFESLDLPNIIRTLFEASAIGNIHSRPHGKTTYTFKFRNRNSTLNLEDRLILHRGMWKAMNLI